jgi:hypothetical protein
MKHQHTSLFKVYGMLRQFHGPLSNPARAISVPEDVIQWLVRQDSDSVSFEIVMELSCAQEYSIAYLLHF